MHSGSRRRPRPPKGGVDSYSARTPVHYAQCISRHEHLVRMSGLVLRVQHRQFCSRRSGWHLVRGKALFCFRHCVDGISFTGNSGVPLTKRTYLSMAITFNPFFAAIWIPLKLVISVGAWCFPLFRNGEKHTYALNPLRPRVEQANHPFSFWSSWWMNTWQFQLLSLAATDLVKKTNVPHRSGAVASEGSSDGILVTWIAGLTMTSAFS